MQYLDYQEYVSIGGICDATAFARFSDRAFGIVDNATHNRIEYMAGVPQRAKALCRDLVEYIARYSTSDMVVSSRSQSAGAVSESESYKVKTSEEIQEEISKMIYDYLGSCFDDNGNLLLYRGAIW